MKRCQVHEGLIRTRLALRATLCWDEDREFQAEEWGMQLAKSPAYISRKMRKTKQGCAWLIGRWEVLAQALDEEGDWTESQKSMGLDLLGKAHEARLKATPLDGDAATRKAFVAKQIGRLNTLKAEVLEALDGEERDLAEVGFGPDLDRELMLARRYENACRKQFQWAHNALDRGAEGVEVPPSASTRSSDGSEDSIASRPSRGPPRGLGVARMAEGGDARGGWRSPGAGCRASCPGRARPGRRPQAVPRPGRQSPPAAAPRRPSPAATAEGTGD